MRVAQLPRCPSLPRGRQVHGHVDSCAARGLPAPRVPLLHWNRLPRSKISCRVKGASSGPSDTSKGGYDHGRLPVPRVAATDSFETNLTPPLDLTAVQHGFNAVLWKLGQVASSQFLPLALLSALAAGFVFPSAGVLASKLQLHYFATCGIFFLQGLCLRRGEAMKALSLTGCVAFGLASILLFTPMAAFLALQVPVEPHALALGLAVFCCGPTTLSTGVTLTGVVGGNTALALLLTVGSNLLSIFTMPFILPFVLSSAGVGHLSLSPWPLLKQLLLIILLPLAAGSLVRSQFQEVAHFVDTQRKLVQYCTAFLLSLVPWMQVSMAVSQQVSLSGGAICTILLAGAGLHLLMMLFNMSATRLLKLGGADPIEAARASWAIVLVCSQKTLPVAIVVLSKMGSSLGESAGLAVIPCVICHLLQIVMDSLMVSHIAKVSQQQQQRQQVDEQLDMQDTLTLKAA